MFLRRWSGLPADPEFPSDLAGLGYFINPDDEIRSIECPDYYFKYFLTKNGRYNERQRFALNTAVRTIILTRLASLGLTTLRLPLNPTPSSTTTPHVPILHTPNLSQHSRIILLLGDAANELGVLAHRVIGRRGGINQGSMVNLVQSLLTQPSSAADPAPPGIVLGNPGELWWWPQGGRGLTPRTRHSIPMASEVLWGRHHDGRVNEVPGQRDVGGHVGYLFGEVLPFLMGERTEVRVDVVAVGEGADAVYRWLGDGANWERYEARMGCLVNLGGFYAPDGACDGFKRFLQERGRAYHLSSEPLGVPLSTSPDADPSTRAIVDLGCPMFSGGETANMVELLPIEAQGHMLKWMHEVAMAGEGYVNPMFEVFTLTGEEEEDANKENVEPGENEGGEDEVDGDKENVNPGEKEEVDGVMNGVQGLAV